MRRISAGISGSGNPSPGLGWDALALPDLWLKVIDILQPESQPRPVQISALRDYRILESRRNLIVSAPTNGGKSLVGLLVLFEAIQQKKRAVLLEPLRALAREKADELGSLAPRLGEVLGCDIKVSISTGDYRLDDETLSAPPPDQGELIIATPERLEAILRNPDYDGWIQSIGAVCVDEAHMIGQPKRGPTLEYLITSFLCLPTPPRLVLLSATLGDTEKACNWLTPCDPICIQERYPPLEKEVLILGEEEKADKEVIPLAQAILADLQASFLIFVYRTQSAEQLAARLNEAIGERCGVQGAMAYHAQMALAQKEQVRTVFMEGSSRCVVSTTALALGMNLPATHVLVRDSVFPGVGELSVGDLLQMMGRAGRGNATGKAMVMVRPGEGRQGEELAQCLQREEVADLMSHFEREQNQPHWRRRDGESEVQQLANSVAAQLSRHTEEGITADELRIFFERSLGGQQLVQQVEPCLHWLTDPCRLLAHRDENDRYGLTTLGLNTVRATLPLEVAAGMGCLIRDLLSEDPDDHFLEAWQPLDLLLILDLLCDATKLRVFSRKLVDQVDAWMERHPEYVPMLFREWLTGSEENSKADQVLGSLGVDYRDGKDARKKAYGAIFRAIVLYERGQGKPVEEVEREWQVKNLGGIEERWRDNILWLLAGMSKILDVRCFYYHLIEECGADRERVQRVKTILRRMKRRVLELQEHLKYCSALGPLLRSLKRMWRYEAGPSIGIQTIRRLEEKGIQQPADLVNIQVDELVSLGVRRDRAQQIHSYIRRRLQ